MSDHDPQPHSSEESKLITLGIPITQSGDVTKCVFLNEMIPIGPIDKAKVQLFISSRSDANAPIIVDDTLAINGRGQRCHRGTKANVNLNNQVGDPPDAYYNPVEALEVTDDVRLDGKMYFAALDNEGGFFCCSSLYLRIVPRPVN